MVALSVIPAVTAIVTNWLNRRAEDRRTTREHERQDAQRRRDEEREDDARHLAERRSAYVALMVAAREAEVACDQIRFAIATEQLVGDETTRLDDHRREVDRSQELVDLLGSTPVRAAAIAVRITHREWVWHVRDRIPPSTPAAQAPANHVVTPGAAATEALKEFNRQARFELGLDKPIPGFDD